MLWGSRVFISKYCKGFHIYLNIVNTKDVTRVTCKMGAEIAR